MLSRAQQILIKRAQREAGLDDSEYRDALEAVSGCRSTKDSRLADRHVDLALAYFEAIYWRKVDSGALQANCRHDAVFRKRRYWAEKNTHQETSRDRYAAAVLSQEISRLESVLAALGFDERYCAAIRENVTRGQSDPHALHLYRAALQRTLRAKQNNLADLIAAETSRV